MNYQLYRKYRPNTFDTIYGQEHVIKTLKSEVINNNLVNSYIFCGQKGTGKTSIAKIFSKAVNCLNLKDGNPCNECVNCQAINNNQSLDFLELDAASNNGVDQIRSLTSSCDYQPTSLKYKIFIIDEAHMLTISAWNALLKTIEEPKNNVIFIFATTEFSKIPETIISRSQRFDFYKINHKELTNLILKVANNENIKIDNDSIEMIINISQGSARDCLTLLDQLASSSNNNITISLTNKIFGLVDINTIIEFINNVLNKQYDLVIKKINQFDNEAVNFYQLYTNIINYLMDVYIYQKTNDKKLLNYLDENNVLKIRFTNNLLNIIDYLTNNLNKLKNSDNLHVIFEFIIFNLIDQYINNNQIKSQLNNETIQITKQIDLNTLNINETNNIKSSLKNESNNKNIKNTNKTNLDVLNINESNNKQDSLNLGTKLINPKEIFKIKEHHFEDKKTNNIQNEFKTSQIVIDDVNLNINNNENENDDLEQLCYQKYHDDAFKIIFNKDKNITETLNEKLKVLLDSNQIQYSSIINSFLNIKKFVVCSPNGSIILMDNLYTCERFNKNNKNEEFLTFFKDYFSLEQYIIALDKNTIKKILDDYKINKPIQLDDICIESNSTKKQNLINKILEIGNKINKK